MVRCALQLPYDFFGFDRIELILLQRVFDSIHPERRNLTAIRGYKRFGGLSNDPYTDPQDRSWFGPHDRLFSPEEAEPLQFKPGAEHGSYLPPLPRPLPFFLVPHLMNTLDSMVLGLGRRW
jgi:hypothetical protein